MIGRVIRERLGFHFSVANIAPLFVAILCSVHLLGCDALYYGADREATSVEEPCADLDSQAVDGACDEDGDGVSNGFDQCPHSMENVYVDSFGCVYDSDHDGVNNPFDRCPGSPQGEFVDSSGCSRSGQSE